MWFSDFMLIFAIYSDAIYLTFIAAQRLVMMRKHSLSEGSLSGFCDSCHRLACGLRQDT